MSLRGWNKGKSPTMLCERKKEGEKNGEEGKGRSKHLPAALHRWKI